MGYLGWVLLVTLVGAFVSYVPGYLWLIVLNLVLVLILVCYLGFTDFGLGLMLLC